MNKTMEQIIHEDDWRKPYQRYSETDIKLMMRKYAEQVIDEVERYVIYSDLFSERSRALDDLSKEIASQVIDY